MVENADALLEFAWNVFEAVFDWFFVGGEAGRDDPPFRYPDTLYEQRPPDQDR